MYLTGMTLIRLISGTPSPTRKQRLKTAQQLSLANIYCKNLVAKNKNKYQCKITINIAER